MPTSAIVERGGKFPDLVGGLDFALRKNPVRGLQFDSELFQILGQTERKIVRTMRGGFLLAQISRMTWGSAQLHAVAPELL